MSMELQRVVEGLEQLRDAGWTNINDYYLPIMKGALTLLKGMEPRVMTEQELDRLIASLDGEARVWIEHRMLGVYCATLWIGNPNRGDRNFYDPRYEYYYAREAIGICWRPWTQSPTDEQRQEVKWD